MVRYPKAIVILIRPDSSWVVFKDFFGSDVASQPSGVKKPGKWRSPPPGKGRKTKREPTRVPDRTFLHDVPAGPTVFNLSIRQPNENHIRCSLAGVSWSFLHAAHDSSYRWNTSNLNCQRIFNLSNKAFLYNTRTRNVSLFFEECLETEWGDSEALERSAASHKVSRALYHYLYGGNHPIAVCYELMNITKMVCTVMPTSVSIRFINKVSNFDAWFYEFSRRNSRGLPSIAATLMNLTEYV